MTSGYQALTEKEKETLRLLVNGYDAKSMARHLGLSVHTVNERLRDARRKMAVSSSREAARQLREVESQTPKLLGDESLGDASPASDMEHLRYQASDPGTTRRAGWIIGGIVMSIALAFYALASLSGSAPTPATAQTSAQAAAENATVEASRAWLALVDQGDWNASWDATGQAFKALNTSAKWAEVSQRVRTPLGAVKSRDVVTVNYAPAPPYGYWIVKFRTSYANKANAIETLSLAWEDDSWKVVGITIE